MRVVIKKPMGTIIFDLDGTISDPATGITRSINHALAKLGYEVHPETALHRFIGPSLHVAFTELTGRSDAEFLARGVEAYRERYILIGYKENVIYPGVKDALGRLREMGYTLCIATSKRPDIACKVIEFLGLWDYFQQIQGCDVQVSKASLLAKMLEDESLRRPMIMIGDRDNDFNAAFEAGITSVAVRWGYGNEAEYRLASASVSDPNELVDVISQLMASPHGGK